MVLGGSYYERTGVKAEAGPGTSASQSRSRLAFTSIKLSSLPSNPIDKTSDPGRIRVLQLDAERLVEWKLMLLPGAVFNG